MAIIDRQFLETPWYGSRQMASSAVIGIFLVLVFYVAVLKAVQLVTRREAKAE